MSIPKQDHQGTFYDASFLARELFKPNDKYEIFRQHVYPALQSSREMPCRLYCSDNGRGAIKPVTMAGVTLLQFMEKAPDRTAADNVRLPQASRCRMHFDDDEPKQGSRVVPDEALALGVETPVFRPRPSIP